MTKKRIILFSSLLLIVIIATTFAVFSLIHKDTSPDNTQSSSDTIKTNAYQNKLGDEAFKAALVAMNQGNAAEAKKQLDSALSYYKATHNTDGISNVNAQYPILNAVPEKLTKQNTVAN